MMHANLSRLATGALALFALAGCNVGGTGYVEIKVVPTTARLPTLYLDADTVEAKNRVTVLRQPVGTAKLQVDAGEGKVLLCQVVVRKDRITTVTLSPLERPPRCQCERTDKVDRICIG
jgi:hypothetical protein